MKTPIQLFLLSLFISSVLQSQVYVGAQGTVQNQFAFQSFDLESVVPGIVARVGYFDWTGYLEYHFALTLLKPSESEYYALSMGGYEFTDSALVSERVSSWAIGLNITYLYGADVWDNFRIGARFGLDYVRETIDQTATDAGQFYEASTPVSGPKVGIGLSSLYYITEHFSINGDLYYHASRQGFNALNPLDPKLQLNNSINLNLGASFYF
ncbi:MAG TPA: hypothetical protein PLJ00_00110 [Chitinophagales bacterium]|nr:hypothetical protein [Chitinophagales bacterium]HRG84285.1 hypothetical protein [Chitinophagales bacterium]HRH52058.1 hypothetical protein [Chitinophagales bacterium]